MTPSSLRARQGFTLIELAIVMGIIGALIAGIFAYSTGARQRVKVEQAVEADYTAADLTRASYAAMPSIGGAYWSIMQLLVQTQALPANLVAPVATSCNGVTTTFANNPLTSAYDPCGTFRVCAWNYGATTGCGAVGGAQYFALEFTQLDYGSCAALAQSVIPTRPAGLMDIYINGASVRNTGTGLPVTPAIATRSNASFPTVGCTAGSITNVLDFVYTLRQPVSS